jgi:hypothetical protein
MTIRTGLRNLAVVVVFAAVFGISAVQAHAQKECDQYTWNWPFCHLHKPVIQRHDFGWPRPPLADKQDKWCGGPKGTDMFAWGDIVHTSSGKPYYSAWWMLSHTKHQYNFWPDYYQNVWVGIYWNGTAWLQTSDPYDKFYIDCDTWH